MQIESVSVRHFGLLHHVELKLGDKLNVVEGSNESGKSTLSAFVRFMLYGFPSDEEGILERRHRTSWDTGTAEGSMTVRVGGRRYRIERYSAILRTPAGGEEYRDRTRTVDAREGSLVTERSAGEFFFGVPNEVFVSSAFVGQLDDTCIGEERMTEQISNLLFTGDKRVSAERAAAMLRDRRDELLAAASEGGDASLLRARAEALVREREAAVEINRSILQKEAALAENRRRRGELERELDRLSSLKESFKTVATLNHFDKLHTLEREKYLLDGEEAEFRLRHTKNGFFPDSSYRTELTINLRVAGDAYATYRAAQEELVTHREESERGRDAERVLWRVDRHGGEGKVRAGLSRLIRNAALFFCAFGALLALSVLALALGLGGALPRGALAPALSGGAAVLSLAALLLGETRRRRARAFARDYGFASVSKFSRFLLAAEAHRAAAEERARSLRRAEEMLERAKRTYLASYSSLSETVARWGRELPEVGVGTAIGAIVKEIDSILSVMEGYAGRQREMDGEIGELRGRLGEESEQELRAALSPEIRDALCDISYEEVLQGVRLATEEIEALEAARAALEGELEALRGAAVNPVLLDEQIRALGDQIAAVRELQSALSLAYDAVSGAETNLRGEIRPRLSDYARRLMSAMTDGKYDEVGVSESLTLEFRRDETSRSVDYLSGGTRDLAYIALRLAYIDLLYKEMPPLVFDESFAHQDNFRATCTMKALRALAEEGVQSLIFTCRSRESTIAREVDRKYKHIKMEKLRAEADAAAAAIASEAEAVPVLSEQAPPAPALTEERTRAPKTEGVPLTGDPELDALLALGAGADPLAATLDTLLQGDAEAVAAGEITSFAVPAALMGEGGFEIPSEPPSDELPVGEGEPTGETEEAEEEIIEELAEEAEEEITEELTEESEEETVEDFDEEECTEEAEEDSEEETPIETDEDDELPYDEDEDGAPLGFCDPFALGARGGEESEPDEETLFGMSP